MHPRTTLALRTLAGALIAGGAAAGCGGARSPAAEPTVATPADECVLGTPDSARRGQVLVAMGDPADSMLLARQRLDTPIRLDCLARRRPGLASAWTSDSTGRTWTLTLARARAGTLAETWRARPEASAALRWGGVESVVPLDDRRLVVTFRTPHDSLPPLFADPALGLMRDSLPSAVLRPMLSAGDARDAIDRGADLVRTADPAALEYAAARADLTAVPLPWSRTYALVLPAEGAGLGRMVGIDSLAFRAELAGSAVQVEARGAEPPFWWEAKDCPAPATGSSAVTASPAVLYSRSDPVARALAERLVALSELPGAIARGVGPSELATALHTGTGRAYVVALPRRALVPCREIAAWPPGAVALALIDTRARLILRKGVPPLEVDYDGAIRPVQSR